MLAANAMLVLAGTTLAIKLLPFRAIGRLASQRLRRRANISTKRRIVNRIAWAVSAAARRAPWKAVCFQQGLAAQIMLRQSGVDSTLFFGATSNRGRGLEAHVWVRAGGIDVIGCENADQYAVLATFPPYNELEPAGL